MRVKELIGEIQGYQDDLTHKSVFDIFRVLDNNKSLFLEVIEPDYFNHLLSNFEKLAYGNPIEYQTVEYKNECRKQYDLLLFYMNKVI